MVTDKPIGMILLVCYQYMCQIIKIFLTFQQFTPFLQTNHGRTDVLTKYVLFDFLLTQLIQSEYRIN